MNYLLAEGIRRQYATGTITRAALARAYAVSPSTIDRILARKQYAAPEVQAPKPTGVKRYRLTDLKRTRAKHPPRTFTLLRQLGIPRSEIKWGPFFSANSMEAEYLAKLAKAKYRERISRLHPDRNGDGAEAAALNEIWATLRDRFARQGIHV